MWHPTRLAEEEMLAVREDQKRYINKLGDGSSGLMNIPERYVNHSDTPNTHPFGDADVAIRDILIDEEITSSYVFKKVPTS